MNMKRSEVITQLPLNIFRLIYVKNSNVRAAARALGDIGHS
jgi:hypothetical protein